MLEKSLFFGVLYDYYGTLLKENQAIVIDLYYNQDLSLGEIAEELNISRAGIHDTLKRAEKNLTEFEEKLSLHSKLETIYGSAEKIIEIIDKIDDTKYSNELNDIRKEAEKILNEG